MDISTIVFGNTIQAYIIFVGILAAGYLIGKTLSWLIQNVIKKLAAKTETKLDDVMVDVCHGPLVFAIFILTLWIADPMLVFPPAGEAFYSGLLRILITGLTVASGHRRKYSMRL